MDSAQHAQDLYNHKISYTSHKWSFGVPWRMGWTGAVPDARQYYSGTSVNGHLFMAVICCNVASMESPEQSSNTCNTLFT